MASEVYINVPVVRGFGKTFGEISEVLEGVNKALDVVQDLLRIAAFVGVVAAQVGVQLIEQVQPTIKTLAENTAELGKDVLFSVDAYERGDEQGATRFY